MKIIVDEDCGNAPKKQCVKDFLIAFAKCNNQEITDMLAENTAWVMIGSKTIQGRDKVMATIEEMQTSKISELKIENIISHGDRCAADGTMRFEDGSAVAFCDIYTFSSHSKDAKIMKVVSYDISIK